MNLIFLIRYLLRVVYISMFVIPLGHVATDGRRVIGLEAGTSSPSPAGSTYTTASESGGPNTIESEPGNYLSASEDPASSLIAAVTSNTSVVMPVATAATPRVVEGAQAYVPMTLGYCNSSEVTVIPQHTHDTTARVSPPAFQAASFVVLLFLS